VGYETFGPREGGRATHNLFRTEKKRRKMEGALKIKKAKEGRKKRKTPAERDSPNGKGRRDKERKNGY